MSTVAPPPPAPHVNPALVDSEQFIDDHIGRTRRALKLVDFAGGVLTLVVGLLTFLLIAGLIDHWVIPGGLGQAGRLAFFGLLLAGMGWFAWRQFVPLVRSINPVYAAHTIEQASPSLKNSLLNALLFRHHRQQMSAKVYHALEQQAAQRLSTANADAAIDYAGLLRLGYALLAVVAACVVYSLLSPKNLAVSAARIIDPWADLTAPSRVQILNVEPGETSVAIGERVNISAEVLAVRENEPVRLRYTTADESLVDETILMAKPTGAGRFAADLPRATDSGAAAGVQQELEYWIEAGDARSRRFKLSVFQRPTIVVQRVHYNYPAYTGEPTKTVDNVGDISGLEGTEAAIEALASEPIKSAYVDFDSDGRSDVRMTVDGRRATASFKLQLRPDRRTPWHLNYALRFTSAAGRANDDPVQYQLDVQPDYAPEIRITQPEEPDLTVRADETVLIGVEARDPDYAVQTVRLVGRVGEKDMLLAELNSKNHVGLYKHLHPFVPADKLLKAGDVLEYWAEAHDNRHPDANVALTEHRRLRIAGANGENQQQQPNGQGQGGNGDQNNNGAAGGQGPNDDPLQNNQQQGGDGGGESPNGEGQQQGENSSGGGQSAGGQNGEGQAQQDQTGEGQSAEGQTGENGDAGADASGNGGATGQQQTSENTGQTGDQQNGGEGGQHASDGQSGDNAAPGANGSNGGDKQGAKRERVSSAGDDDGSAFERMNEVLGDQGDQQGGDANPSGDGDAASAAGQSGDNSDQDSNADNAAANAADRTSDAGDNAGGQTAEGNPTDDPSGGAEQTTSPDNNPGQSSGANTPRDPDDPQNAATPEGEGETPAGADNAGNPNNGQAPAGDDNAGQPGAPHAGNKLPREQADGGDSSETEMEGEPPTEDSRGKTESDARGDQGGDRSGEGQRGGGQQADNAGQGEAGSHEPSDTGAGQSADQGAGETGTQGGDQQLADGQTGESSGDQQGNGSQTGSSAQQQDGAPSPDGEAASTAPPPGDNANQNDGAEGASQQPSGDQHTGEQPGAQGDQQGSQGGDQQGSTGAQQGNQADQQPGGAADNGTNPPDQTGGQQTPGEQSSGDQSQAGQSGSPPQDGQSPADPDPFDESQSTEDPSGNPGSAGSGGGSAARNPERGGTQGGGVDGDGVMREPGGDAANLDYARKQTDFVLERLSDQLAKQKVDPKLLDTLGWTEDELRRFVDRWKGLKAAAEGQGDAATDAQAKLNAALRSLGLRPRSQLNVRGAVAEDQLRDLNDSYRARAPREYAERVRAYMKGASQ
jgi:hypothetical protein